MKNVCDKAQIIHPERLTIAPTARIDDFCLINAAGGVIIGEYSAIHAGSHIIGGGHFEMGSYSVITYNCTIITAFPLHTAQMSTMVPREFKDSIVGEIIIGNEVFIGSNSVISIGREGKLVIGYGAVIGAGAFIDRDVPPEIIVYPGGQVRKREFKRRFHGWNPSCETKC